MEEEEARRRREWGKRERGEEMGQMFSEKNRKGSGEREAGYGCLVFEKGTAMGLTRPKSGESQGAGWEDQDWQGDAQFPCGKKEDGACRGRVGQFGDRWSIREVWSARVVGIVFKILPRQWASLLLCIWFFFFSTSCMPEKRAWA